MIPIHRPLETSKKVIILHGEVEEILYNDSGEEKERIHLLAGGDTVAVHIPMGCYHTCRSLRSGSAIVEFKNGKYDRETTEDLLASEKKKECLNDAEAKQYAAKMGYDSDTYPVVYFKSDTTGEKAYEEFYIPGEKINMNRFMALCVVEETTRRPMPEVNTFFEKLEQLFAR